MAQDRVESVERALSILEAFSQTRARLSLAELAEETGLYKSTILRLASSLERYGYLARDDDGSFRLGPSLWRLGASYRRTFALDDKIRPVLRDLVASTGETASFFVRDGNERLCLYRENSPEAARHHLDEGVRLPLERGAAGRVLLAHSGSRDEAAMDVLQAGHAISVAERSPDVAAVAVPVFGLYGDFKGALSVSGLLTRFDQEARKGALNLLERIASDLPQRLI